MNADPARQSAEAVAAELLRLSPAYRTTPLLDLPRLAARLGIGQVLAKDESRRPLGSFKSLGGTYAGLRALARACGRDIAALLADPPRPLPALLCASDGNHGLAVAAAAARAGTEARIFLPQAVPALRARRIEAQGGRVVWVDGTYDDAVDAACAAAAQGTGILVPDTGNDPADPVIADVMAGYGVIAAELRRQVEADGHAHPTHLFVQAGVGGLAGAISEGLHGWMAAPGAFVVVEPKTCACVAAALAAGHPVRLDGEFHTAAEMLSCGEVSAAAVATLRRHGVRAVAVSEAALAAAPELLRAAGGPATTPSGAAGLAGLAAVMADRAAAAGFGLGRDSRALIIVTEGPADEVSASAV